MLFKSVIGAMCVLVAIMAWHWIGKMLAFPDRLDNATSARALDCAQAKRGTAAVVCAEIKDSRP